MAGTGARRLRWTVLALIGMLVLAACGSTVQGAARRQLEGGRSGDVSLGSDAGADGATGDAAAADAGGASGGGATGSAAGGRSATNSGRAGGGAGGLAGNASGGSSGASGPGVTDSTINVGIIYAVNAGAANAAIGGTGISQGDEKRNHDVLINDLNAHGGVAGRKVVPVYAELDATSPATLDSQYQAACDTLTQDHKVFVMFAGQSETLIQCAHNRGVVAATTNLTEADSDTFRRFPYYYELNGLNLGRMSAAEVAGLQAQGYFSGWDASLSRPGAGKAKVGVITTDQPSFVRAVNGALVPALAKAGYAPDPANVVRVPRVERTTDIGAIGAAISNAVLRFRSNGVDHVIIIETSGVLSLLFANNADSQRYYPRYGLNSQNGVQALADGGGYPKSQLAGAVGVGWLPSLDITPSENTDDGPYATDARKRCMALYKAHGVTFSDTNARGIGMNNCNDVSFFAMVANSIKGPLNRDTFRAAVERVGPTFQSVDTFATNFSPTQHDGAAAVRYWAYNTSCSCMRYTSGNIPVP
jgi:hypothetical protein